MGGQGGRLGVDHEVAHQLAEPVAGHGDDHAGQPGPEQGARLQLDLVPAGKEPGEAVGVDEYGELVGGHRRIVGADHAVHEAHGERDGGRVVDQFLQGAAGPVLRAGEGGHGLGQPLPGQFHRLVDQEAVPSRRGVRRSADPAGGTSALSHGRPCRGPARAPVGYRQCS